MHNQSFKIKFYFLKYRIKNNIFYNFLFNKVNKNLNFEKLISKTYRDTLGFLGL